MAPGLRKTLIGLVLLSVLLAAGGILLFRACLPIYYFSFFPYLVLIFLIVNSVVFIIFYRSSINPITSLSAVLCCRRSLN